MKALSYQRWLEDLIYGSWTSSRVFALGSLTTGVVLAFVGGFPRFNAAKCYQFSSNEVLRSVAFHGGVFVLRRQQVRQLVLEV